MNINTKKRGFIEIYGVSPRGRRFWICSVAGRIATGKRGGLYMSDMVKMRRISSVELSFNTTARVPKS